MFILFDVIRAGEQPQDKSTAEQRISKVSFNFFFIYMVNPLFINDYEWQGGLPHSLYSSIAEKERSM